MTIHELAIPFSTNQYLYIYIYFDDTGFSSHKPAIKKNNNLGMGGKHGFTWVKITPPMTSMACNVSTAVMNHPYGLSIWGCWILLSFTHFNDTSSR
jgi:hypothetical protein